MHKGKGEVRVQETGSLAGEKQQTWGCGLAVNAGLGDRDFGI